VYQFPWYGIQGEGGYFVDNDTTFFPGIDLVEISNARSVVLWGATFPNLADNTSEIINHTYTDLNCDSVFVKKFDIAQKYIQGKGYSKVNAVIKVRTGQSNGSFNLCGTPTLKPAWSHVCNSAWAGNQLISATPNDIDTLHCSYAAALFDTLVATVQTSGGCNVIEYVRDENGDWDEEYRVIVENTSTPLIPGDIEFSYNR